MKTIEIKDVKEKHLQTLIEDVKSVCDVNLTFGTDDTGEVLNLYGDFATFIISVLNSKKKSTMRLGFIPSILADPAFTASVIIGLHAKGYKLEMAGAYIENIEDGSILMATDADSSERAYIMREEHRLMEAEYILEKREPNKDEVPKLILPDNKIIH